MAGRGLKRSWVVLVAFGGLMLLTLIGPRVLRGLGFFRVRRVEIAGLQYLAPAKIMSAIGLAKNASVFDDPAPLARRALAVPGIKSAVIRRRMPGTLQIAVEEAVPVALAPAGGGKLALLDSRGKVLPFDPATSAPDLPLAVGGDGVVAGVLAKVSDYAPDLFARVSEGWRVGPDVVLEVEGRRSLVRLAGFRGGHSSGDGGGAVTCPAGSPLSGARRPLRRPGDRPRVARVSPPPQRLVAALDLGSTKVVGADRRGHR